MFIYERILSLFIYFVILLITTFLIQKKSNFKHLNKILFIYVILLSIMAYFYKPYKTADLYRIFEQMKLYYEPLNFQQFLNWASHNSNFFGMLYFYVFSKTGIYNLMPAITAFIFYGLVFKIFLKSQNIFYVNQKDLVFIFLFIMAGGQYVEVISGIRFMLSMVIVSYCIFCENYCGKNIFQNILLYIFSSLIHPASLVISLLRFIYLLFQTEKNKYNKIFKVIFISIFLIFIFILAKSQIVDALNKAEAYATNDIYSYTWEYIIAFLIMIYMYFVLKCFKRIDKINYKKNLNYIRFFKMMYIITFCLFFVYSIFHRYRSFLSIIFIPILFSVYKKMEEKGMEEKRKNFNNITLLFLIILFVLIFVRGNLCGLNFFLFN